jgi:hypothetical protein
MRRTRLVTVAVLATLSIVAATAAIASSGNITGFPAKINTVNLTGYHLQTFYPLGTNTGNTFDQSYVSDSRVTAVGVEGPGKGVTFASKYVAMPIDHNLLMVTWYTPDGTLEDVFLMNFNTGIVSDVAPNKHPQSLGTVKILQAGAQAIP